VNAASRTMARMLGNNDVAFESARSQFWIVDAHVSWIPKTFFLIFCDNSFRKDHTTLLFYQY
jgi:hypothetical protein